MSTGAFILGLQSAIAKIQSAKASLISDYSYAQHQTEDRLAALSQDPRNERLLEKIINPDTGSPYTDAQIQQAILNAEIRASENSILEEINNGAQPVDLLGEINPATGEPYTLVEINQAIENANTRVDVASVEDRLYEMSLDPRNERSLEHIINPETGSPYTDSELQDAINNGRLRAEAAAANIPAGSVQLDAEIPERFIDSANENILVNVNSLSEPIKITGGYMEPSGHGYKNQTALFIGGSDPTDIQSIGPGSYNIGIDYVLNSDPPVVDSWFNGTVISADREGGYGNRVRIETDQTFTYNGEEYTIYTAYAHLDSIEPGLKAGDPVDASTSIGIMGGDGASGPNSYPPHVDLQIWIEVDGVGVINISPNLLNTSAP